MKTKFLLILAIGALITINSCRKGEDGAPGPAGANGQSGAILVDTLGYISGNVAGTLYNGNSVDFNFRLPYLVGMSNNSMYEDSEGYKYFHIVRYDSIAESFMEIYFYIDDFGTFSGQTATFNIIQKNSNSSFTTIGSGGEVNYPEAITLNSFYTWGSTGITFNNASYNSTTGIVDFDYTLEVFSSQNTTGNKLDITGRIRTKVFTQSFREVSAN